LHACKYLRVLVGRGIMPHIRHRRCNMDNKEKTVGNQAGQTSWQKAKILTGKVNHVIDIILTVLFRLRKVIMAVPVVYFAVKLAKYNMENLPQVVGINMQANGAFADTISRQLAIMGPFGLTCGCLGLMFLSRKALYPWAISVFTLVLPILLLLSNQYPA